jgi:hypothetical protein
MQKKISSARAEEIYKIQINLFLLIYFAIKQIGISTFLVKSRLLRFRRASPSTFLDKKRMFRFFFKERTAKV